MNSSRIRLAAAALSLVLVAACGGGGGGSESSSQSDAPPQKGGTLRFADEGEAVSLNPFIAVENTSQRVFAQVLEPLFRTDEKGQVVPWLVSKSTPSEDFKTLTLELRPDVSFSDGKPLTPEDVVYSIDQIRSAPSWKAVFAEISSVEVASPTSVVIATSTPSPALPTSLSLPFAAIVPQDLGGKTPEEFGESPVGTGPFKVASWDHSKSLTLERNDSYWDPKFPLLDKIVFDTVASDTSRAQQLRSGDLDLIGAPPLPQVATLNKGTTTVGEYALAYPRLLILNQQKPVFKDIRVREAISLAVDRNAALKVGDNGVGEVGGSWFVPALKYYKDIQIEQDATKAEKLLADAVADGIDPTFTLRIRSGSSGDKVTSEIIKQNLEDIGFTVDIEQVDGSALIAEFSAGNYEAGFTGITSDIVDPSEIVGFYLDLNGLWTYADTTEVRRLLEAAKQEPDEAVREDLYGQIQQVVFDDHSMITLSYRPWVYGMADNVAGFELSPTGVPWFATVGFKG